MHEYCCRTDSDAPELLIHRSECCFLVISLLQTSSAIGMQAHGLIVHEFLFILCKFCVLFSNCCLCCGMANLIDLSKSTNDRECCFLAVSVSQISLAIGNARAWKYGVGIFRPQGRVFMS